MLCHVSSESVSQRVYTNTLNVSSKTRNFEVITKRPVTRYMMQREWERVEEAVRLWVQRYALASGLAIEKPEDFSISIKVKITEQLTHPQTGESERNKYLVSGGPFAEMDKQMRKFSV